MYTGWDWAAESHDVTVMDKTATVIDRWAMSHDAEGIDAALTRLTQLGQPEFTLVAIEAKKGLVIDRLIGAGFSVVPIHPNAFNAARPRWDASRSKSDPGDSYKLADYVRTDSHRLARLTKVDQATADLQALCRVRDDHVESKIAAMNRLDAILDNHWPGAGRVFFRLDSNIALSFLERYPTPESAAKVGVGRMRRFCERVSYSGGKTPADLVERLRSAPEAASPLSAEVVEAMVLTQVGVLGQLLDTIRKLETRIEQALTAHPKAQILETLPRVGRLNLAQIIGEVGPVLVSAVDVEHACAQVGATPVTRESGKQRHVSFRWTANTRARKALVTFADNSRHDCEWAAERYGAARARQNRHPHAVRILTRSWMRVIWACWHSNTVYEPGHARQNQQELAAGGWLGKLPWYRWFFAGWLFLATPNDARSTVRSGPSSPASFTPSRIGWRRQPTSRSIRVIQSFNRITSSCRYSSREVRNLPHRHSADRDR